MKNLTPETLAGFIEKMVEDNPEQVISTFIDEINVFNVKELNQKATLLAKGLMYIGVNKGDAVALVLSCSTNCLTFLIALAKIGAVLVPINKEYPAEFIKKILFQANVSTIGFYADQFLSAFKSIVPDYLNNERGFIKNPDIPKLKNVITFGSIKNRGIFTTREIMLLGEHTDDFEIENVTKELYPDDTFIMLPKLGRKNSLSFDCKTNKEIVTDNFSFPALQNFLINTI
jgi:fatty-acyl-CoA synthase